MFARCLPWMSALFLTGCVVDFHPGPARHQLQDFDRKGAERLRVELRMGTGELRVRGGAAQLAHADFSYNLDAWKPEVMFHTLGGAREMRIEQPASHLAHMGDNHNVWELQLADDIPLELDAHLGAGEAQLDLGSLSPRRIKVDVGVGEVRMDLRGTPTHDYNVSIHGGVGEATVHLPGKVGIYAVGSGGIGEIHVEGLRRQDDHWVNDAYRDAPVRIHVDVQGGIGQINLLAN